MNDFSHIHIFRTDVRTCTDMEALAPALNAQPGIEQWTLDQEDEDCVLRIISHTMTCPQLIELVRRHGFQCAELT